MWLPQSRQDAKLRTKVQIVSREFDSTLLVVNGDSLWHCTSMFGEGGIRLLDLRFVDDVHTFSTSAHEVAHTFDTLVTGDIFAEVRLQVNVSKNKVLTTQRQPVKIFQNAASKAFYANRWILCDDNVFLNSRIKCFESLVLANAIPTNLTFRSLMFTAVSLCDMFSVRQVTLREQCLAHHFAWMEGANRGTNAIERWSTLVRQMYD